MNAVREIGFVDIAPRIGLGSNDVVLGLGEVEPVLRAVVELESNLGAAVILGNAVPDTHVVHLAVMVGGGFKRIAHQTAERCGQAIGTKS